jgi:hypothetical protein
MQNSDVLFTFLLPNSKDDLVALGTDTSKSEVGGICFSSYNGLVYHLCFFYGCDEYSLGREKLIKILVNISASSSGQ